MLDVGCWLGEGVGVKWEEGSGSGSGVGGKGVEGGCKSVSQSLCHSVQVSQWP